ncbi:MAG: hypothetical protein ACLQVG_28695 [Terriglobia bacterium]
MKPKLSGKAVAAVTVACGFLISAACSKPKSLLPNPGLDFPRQNPMSPPPAPNYSNLPKADSNVPDAQFVELDSGYHTGALFYALAGLPPDYERLAMAASQEYRSTNDAFRKRDLMQALKPQIDQQIQAYKDPRNRYLTAKVGNGLPLGHYDLKTSSFPFTQDLSSGTYHYFNDAPNYTFAFTNGSAFQRFPLSDEQKAKDIEDLVTKGLIYQGDAVGYMFAQGADTVNNRVLMQIIRLVLHGPGQSEVGRY